MPIPWLLPTHYIFPPTYQALDNPNGLLAAGGDLKPERLIEAYRQGIFPWYEAEQPILWWTPSPRTVLYPSQLKISRRFRKTLRNRQFTIRADQQFESVIDACAAPRKESSGTWITSDMRSAYLELAQLGYAHSVETYYDDRLVGGLYGVCLGRIFFGESMFSYESNASKIAFAHLARQLQAFDFALIDCQVYSDHLASLGAEEISREKFEAILNQQVSNTDYDSSALWQAPWEFDF